MNQYNQSEAKTRRVTIWCFGTLIAIASLILWAVLFVNLDRSFDLTDESFYYLWLTAPSTYKMTASMFGHVLAPVFHILGSDPAAFRRLGLVLPTLLAMILCGLVLRVAVPGDDRLTRAVVVLAGAITPISYYVWWVPTPSYNWLPLPASLLLIISLVMLQAGRWIWLSPVLVGLSGLLAFVGKPTTGACFALIYALGVLIGKGSSVEALKHIALSALSCALLFVAASLTFFDANQAVNQSISYINFHGLTSASSGLFASPAAPIGYYVVLAAAIGAYCSPMKAKKMCAGLALLATCCVLLVSMRQDYWRTQGVIVMSVCLAITSVSITFATRTPDRRLLLIISLGHLFPWAISFGTSNPLALMTSYYVAIPSLSTLLTVCLCFGTDRWQPVASAALGVLLAAAALWGADQLPYRVRGPLTSQDRLVDIAGGQLRVDSAMREFIIAIRSDAAIAGFVPGTPVLDFSGDTPGVALLLNGRAPYFPWILGNYEYTERLVVAILQDLGEDRAKTWIVYSDAPRPIDLDFMLSLGINLERDYRLVSTPAHPVYGKPLRLYAPLR